MLEVVCCWRFLRLERVPCLSYIDPLVGQADSLSLKIIGRHWNVNTENPHDTRVRMISAFDAHGESV
jgi:hypothetical protein